MRVRSLKPSPKKVGLTGRQYKKMVKLWKREGKPMELHNVKSKLEGKC